MAKYKVLNDFRDKDTKEIYTKNTEIELTVKRAEEVEATLGNKFLKRMDDPEKKK